MKMVRFVKTVWTVRIDGRPEGQKRLKGAESVTPESRAQLDRSELPTGGRNFEIAYHFLAQSSKPLSSKVQAQSSKVLPQEILLSTLSLQLDCFCCFQLSAFNLSIRSSLDHHGPIH